jgi:hypothetical protein
MFFLLARLGAVEAMGLDIIIDENAGVCFKYRLVLAPSK